MQLLSPEVLPEPAFVAYFDFPTVSLHPIILRSTSCDLLELPKGSIGIRSVRNDFLVWSSCVFCHLAIPPALLLAHGIFAGSGVSV